LFNRDGVLGPLESLGPLGGNMSSIFPPASSQSTTTAVVTSAATETTSASTNSDNSASVIGCSENYAAKEVEFKSPSSIECTNLNVLDEFKPNFDNLDSLRAATTSLVSVGFVSEAAPLIVPSVCWESKVTSGGAMSVACVEARPPVLGEEEVIEGELNNLPEEQQILMQGEL